MGRRTPDGGWAADLGNAHLALSETAEVATSIGAKLQEIGVSVEHVATADAWVHEALAEAWERGRLAARTASEW